MQQKITALIVEDNLDDFYLLKEVLESSDEIKVCLHHAERLANAVAAAAALPIDVAVIDLSLPDSTGLDTYLAFSAACPEIPTIIMTGVKDYDTATLAVHSGAQDYLFKGEASATAIVRTIRYAIERQQAHRQLEAKVVERTVELSAANAELSNKIEELRREKGRREQSEEILRNIFDGILDPLFVLDRSARIQTMNQAAVAYYGVSSVDEAVGRKCHLALCRRPRPCQGCDIPALLTAGEHCGFERQGISGPFAAEHVVIYPLKPRDGGEQAFIVRIQDITQQKLLEKKIIRSEKMASLGVLVSSIAHEINNPNNFISFNIPILREYLNEIVPIVDRHAGDVADFEPCNLTYPQFRQDLFNLLDNIENGSERINAFVTNLREYSHEAPKKTRIRFRLNEIVDKVLSICRSQIKKSVKSFTMSVPDDLPGIYTEPHALEQILINFLLNACQAADKAASWIRLEAGTNGESTERSIRVAVSDNGCGIDDATQLKIFDPFFTTKTKETGTGLGLYVCHSLAERWGWRIELSSRPGEGSCFTLILPIENGAGETSAGDVADRP